jgi:hypothetical protein
VGVIKKIISGGQTGADRAALDVAIRHGFPHGGWCPKGRLAEDGPIGVQYCLAETESRSYPVRTRRNVRDSDATVIFTLGAALTGGSLKTLKVARELGKPHVHIACAGCYQSAVSLQKFVDSHGVRILNVAGSRESKEPGIYDFVQSVLEDAFFWSDNHPWMIGGPGEG